MPRFQIVHTTTYTYDQEALESYSQVRLTPLETFCQKVQTHTITVNPVIPVFSYQDYFGNNVHEFSVPYRHKFMQISAKSEVITYAPSMEPLQSRITVKEAQDWFSTNQYEFFDYMIQSQFTPISPFIQNFADQIFPPERSMVEGVLELNRMFTSSFKYRTGSTTINTPIDTVLNTREGVCQDFSHLMIATLRAKGLGARYVSGYIETYGEDSDLIGSEQSHAWLDVYIPGESWFGLDPTNNICSSEQHVRIAVGRDFNDISPVRGTFNGSGHQRLTVHVSMRKKQEEREARYQKHKISKTGT